LLCAWVGGYVSCSPMNFKSCLNIMRHAFAYRLLGRGVQWKVHTCTHMRRKTQLVAQRCLFSAGFFVLQVYHTVEQAVYSHTHLLYNRHLDQLLLCALYGYCKVCVCVCVCARARGQYNLAIPLYDTLRSTEQLINQSITSTHRPPPSPPTPAGAPYRRHHLQGHHCTVPPPASGFPTCVPFSSAVPDQPRFGGGIAGRHHCLLQPNLRAHHEAVPAARLAQRPACWWRWGCWCWFKWRRRRRRKRRRGCERRSNGDGRGCAATAAHSTAQRWWQRRRAPSRPHERRVAATDWRRRWRRRRRYC
jgi:hypothetical protein